MARHHTHILSPPHTLTAQIATTDNQHTPLRTHTFTSSTHTPPHSISATQYTHTIDNILTLRTQTTTSTSCIPVVLPPSHTVTSPSITVPHSPIEIPQAPPSPIQAPHPSVVQPIPQFHLPGSLPPPFYASSAFTVTPSAFVQPVIQSSASLYTPPSVAPAIPVYPFCVSLINHLNWLTYLLVSRSFRSTSTSHSCRTGRPGPAANCTVAVLAPRVACGRRPYNCYQGDSECI